MNELIQITACEELELYVQDSMLHSIKGNGAHNAIPLRFIHGTALRGSRVIVMTQNDEFDFDFDFDSDTRRHDYSTAEAYRQALAKQQALSKSWQGTSAIGGLPVSGGITAGSVQHAAFPPPLEAYEPSPDAVLAANMAFAALTKIVGNYHSEVRDAE